MKQDERIDLLKEKEKLTQALGSQATLYWDTFQGFIQAKLSKPEFDVAARRLLSENNRKSSSWFLIPV
jgi:hypothetical protein